MQLFINLSIYHAIYQQISSFIPGPSGYFYFHFEWRGTIISRIICRSSSGQLDASGKRNIGISLRKALRILQYWRPFILPNNAGGKAIQKGYSGVLLSRTGHGGTPSYLRGHCGVYPLISPNKNTLQQQSQKGEKCSLRRGRERQRKTNNHSRRLEGHIA